jgi:hypothetical protein
MAINISALPAYRPLTPERFLVLIPVRGWVGPRAIVRLEGLGKLKKKSISSGLESATFLHVRVALCLNELRYHVPHYHSLQALKGASERSRGVTHYVFMVAVGCSKILRHVDRYLRNHKKSHLRSYLNLDLQPDSRELAQGNFTSIP